MNHRRPGAAGATWTVTDFEEGPPMPDIPDGCPYPFPRPSALGVPEALADARRRPAVPVTLPSGDPATLVTRYRDVRALLVDPRLSRNLNRPDAARISRHNRMFQDDRIDPDPPEHTRVRRLVTKAFTPARVADLEPFIHRVVDELLDAMAARGGPVDLNEAFAFPLPIRVICHLLGVPEQDMARFRGWTDAFLSVSGMTGPQIGAAMRELTDYMDELIAAKRRAPGTDLISAMIRVRDEVDGALTEYELRWWCRLLLLVGYETTATQLGGGVAMLLSHPDQLAKLRADPTLLPGAVEELLRWKLVGSSVSMLRYATADIALDGFTIPAGTSVVPAADSANQDETVFADPGTFDITRRNAGEHLTFSLGVHHCIGAGLARTQLRIATGALLDRFPGLRLAVPVDELARQPGALLEGFVAIPVTW
ncbi:MULTISPECIES: cytochrome P450 [unclassified Solwaraspora]|uniref:cytochrome P450 n=1 Tax=unclassified Solwaraspora TaxID=2627926 RepID=UPI00259B8DC4|nr:cytochrome P450 [Solwaraspora sp. WMMA2056]WJK38224.1 cytochrome P450 [Solwaraspora sp. WMMA2056]